MFNLIFKCDKSVAFPLDPRVINVTPSQKKKKCCGGEASSYITYGHFGLIISYKGQFGNTYQNYKCKNILTQKFHFWECILQVELYTYEMR